MNIHTHILLTGVGCQFAQQGHGNRVGWLVFRRMDGCMEKYEWFKNTWKKKGKRDGNEGVASSEKPS